MFMNTTTHAQQPSSLRLFSTTTTFRHNSSNNNNNNTPPAVETPTPAPKLTHVSDAGAAHMVSIGAKIPTQRTATAKCAVRFSNPIVLTLVRENQIKKGDVLGVARIAGIMAAKRAADIIPLCHPIAITYVGVEFGVEDGSEGGQGGGRIDVTATVSCDGKTGVEMEALTAAGAAALTVYDMCKSVDKGMVIEGLRVVLKEGGKSGRWVEGEKASE